MRSLGFAGRADAVGTGAVAVIAVALLASASCYSPDLSGEGHFNCKTGLCPGGFTCSADKICVRDGEPLDGSISDAGVDARSSPMCVVFDPVTIHEGLNSAIDLAFDGSKQELRVSHSVGDEIIVATLQVEAREPQWEAEVFGNRLSKDDALWVTAIAALKGRVAVVFDDRENAGSPLVLRFTTDANGEAKIVEHSEGMSGFVAAGFVAHENLPAQDVALEIVHQFKEDRAQVVTVNPDDAQVLETSFIELEGVSGAVQSGLYNRLVVPPLEGEPEVQVRRLGFIARRDTGADGAVLEPFIAKRTPKEAWSKAVAVGRSTAVMPERVQGLAMAEDDGPHLIWPAHWDEGVGLQYRSPVGAQRDVKPGGDQLKAAGAPAMAILGGRIGLVYIVDEKVAMFTSRLDPDQPDVWLRPIPFEETANDPARQLRIVARPLSGGLVTFDVVYVTASGRLLYRLVECRPLTL